MRGLYQLHTPLAARNAPQPELKVGAHRKVREQAGFLEDIAQRTLMDRHKHLAHAVLPDLAVDLDIRLVSALKARDTAQAGGFTRARVTKQRSDALPRQLQVNVQGEVAVTQLESHIKLRAHVQLHWVGLLRLEYNASSTRKENTNMAPASQCAWAYSNAST